MDNVRYNRIKAVLAEQDKTGTWLSEQMGHSISTVSRWMTNKVEPTCGKFDLVARLSENYTRLHATLTFRRNCFNEQNFNIKITKT